MLNAISFAEKVRTPQLAVEDLDDPSVVAFETGLDARQLKENCLVRPALVMEDDRCYSGPGKMRVRSAQVYITTE
jgi:hypothetical protein